MKTQYRWLGVDEIADPATDVICDGGLYTAIPRELHHHRVTVTDTVAIFRPVQQEQSKVEMEAFSTGSKRSNQKGRGRFDLIPYEGQVALAKRFEMGAELYGEANWLRGQPLSRILSSICRSRGSD